MFFHYKIIPTCLCKYWEEVIKRGKTCKLNSYKGCFRGLFGRFSYKINQLAHPPCRYGVGIEFWQTQELKQAPSISSPNPGLECFMQMSIGCMGCGCSWPCEQAQCSETSLTGTCFHCKCGHIRRTQTAAPQGQGPPWPTRTVGVY